MQKVVGFFSKPENLFVLTLLIGLFTGTYKVVSKASNHNNSLDVYKRQEYNKTISTVQIEDIDKIKENLPEMCIRDSF